MLTRLLRAFPVQIAYVILMIGVGTCINAVISLIVISRPNDEDKVYGLVFCFFSLLASFILTSLTIVIGLALRRSRR